ncbi:MAG TPA: putative sporulation protein YtxC [Methylomusa anaerophila]|uniref:putative sporulation protein YtxC n=1 Tax=Methylomusa anaerophila TaxID=1930071 RepID=UPI000F84A8B7|nr:putative sporulation protein YtxC [Methylomusa anaerophila]HML87330.1 putative sporulation protein YtxC [Methylomusa anaerophila]
MKLLSIGINGAVDEIREKLVQGCGSLVEEGFSIAFEEMKRGGYTFLSCNVSEGELSFRNYERIKNLLKDDASRILANWIVEHEELNIVNKIIEQNYHYFNPDERQSVRKNTLATLHSANSCDNLGFSAAARHKLILNRIMEYLDNHHELVMEGFVNFRLKDYHQKLSLTVDRVVDDFMMELEYKEFIRVLRYFVDVQEPRVEEAHVIISGNGNFKILDQNSNAISNQYLDNLVLKSQSTADINEISQEDLLISALITIAPHSIIIHSSSHARDQDILETVKNVFDGRVILCKGCEMCKVESLTKR